MPKALVLALVGCVAFRAVAAPGDEWPQFRGPGGQGHAVTVALPVEWSPTKNVAWKQALPGAGWSSPAISGGQLFLTAAVVDDGGRPALALFCFASATGRLEWRAEVFGAGEFPLRPAHDPGSPASPTPMVAGDRIYVYFGHHGAACFDRSGRPVWRNPPLRFDPVPVGGGSAILAGDRLIYVADCATAAFVVALDQGTGKIRWRVPRTLPPKMKFSFGSPLPIEVGGQLQIVVPGAGAVTALDPRDGRELWRVRYSRENAAAPRPVFAHGLVFVAAGDLRAELLAIRPDGAGDVTDTHVAWRLTKGAPIVPALLAVGDELYGVNDAGVATCWEAKTGRVHWQERLDGNYSAAPLVAGGRIYFQNETGLGTVVEAKPVFAKLAVNDLGERTIAAAAAADGSLFVRTEKNLYRIASPAPAPSSGSADRSTARPNAFEPVLGRGWRQENARLSAP